MELEAFHFVDQTVFWWQVLAALGCGFIVGLERQLRGKPIGIRTSILICLGTMTFVLMSQQLQGGDPTRVLGQVVTGVGFLGAGLMMNNHGLVSGVTSAASVWLLAAVGCAIGFTWFDLALSMALLAVLSLVCIQWLERVFRSLRRGVHDHRGSPPEGWE